VRSSGTSARTILFGDLELTGMSFGDGTNVLSCRELNPYDVCPKCSKPVVKLSSEDNSDDRKAKLNRLLSQ
jgi:hypothetical protein